MAIVLGLLIGFAVACVVSVIFHIISGIFRLLPIDSEKLLKWGIISGLCILLFILLKPLLVKIIMFIFLIISIFIVSIDHFLFS